MRIVFTALLLLSFEASFATDGPPVAAPAFLPGDAFQFCTSGYYNKDKRTCYTLVYVEERGGNHVFLSNDERGTSEEAVYTHDLALVSQGTRRVTPHSYFLQFPMTSGKAWTGTYMDGDRNRTRTIKVVGYEEVTVPAGTFEAYQLESSNRWNSPRATRAAKERYSYCPTVGFFCAYESVDFDLRFQLVSFKRHGEGVPPAK